MGWKEREENKRDKRGYKRKEGEGRRGKEREGEGRRGKEREGEGRRGKERTKHPMMRKLNMSASEGGKKNFLQPLFY